MFPTSNRDQVEQNLSMQQNTSRAESTSTGVNTSRAKCATLYAHPSFHSRPIRLEKRLLGNAFAPTFVTSPPAGSFATRRSVLNLSNVDAQVNFTPGPPNSTRIPPRDVLDIQTMSSSRAEPIETSYAERSELIELSQVTPRRPVLPIPRWIPVNSRPERHLQLFEAVATRAQPLDLPAKFQIPPHIRSPAPLRVHSPPTASPRTPVRETSPSGGLNSLSNLVTNIFKKLVPKDRRGNSNNCTMLNHNRHT